MQGRGAFTLIELLVVIAIIAILAAIMRSALDKAKPKAQGIACLYNPKQLQLPWLSYCEDSHDTIPPNPPVVGNVAPRAVGTKGIRCLPS